MSNCNLRDCPEEGEEQHNGYCSELCRALDGDGEKNGGNGVGRFGSTS